jgi:hypothetical protein
MNQPDLEAFTLALDNVQRTEAYGYTFFFVGDDHLVPFVTLADSDNEHDDVSQLNREGVYRVNIGVSRATFQALVGGAGAVDYWALNVFLPHPHYAAQNFICILNPAGENAEKTKGFIVEAHAIAAARLARRAEGRE